MVAISEVELFCSLPGWQHYGNRIEKTFNFDDFSAAARFVGRMTDDAASPAASPPLTSAAIASRLRSPLGTTAP